MSAPQQQPQQPQQVYIPVQGQQDPRVSHEERIWAVVSHALSFVEGGIIGPLILYVIKKDSSPFVAFHALQSVYFGLAMLVGTLLTFVTIIGPLALVVAYWVFEILACVKSYNGEWYKLPIIGNWAAKTHPIPDVYPAQPGPQVIFVAVPTAQNAGTPPPAPGPFPGQQH